MSQSQPVPGPAENEAQKLSPEALALKAKRQELAALQAARVKKVKAAVESDGYQLAKAERELREEQAIADCEERFGLEEEGKIGLVRPGQSGLVIVIPPSDSAFKRHNDAGSTSSVALMKLVGPCLKWPSLDEFELLCKSQPATLVMAAEMVGHLAGWKQQDFSKK